jgi:hypothetical protein
MCLSADDGSNRHHAQNLPFQSWIDAARCWISDRLQVHAGARLNDGVKQPE